jgi:hypothetical protein
MAQFPNDPYELGFWPPNRIPGVYTYASLPLISNLKAGTDVFTSDAGVCIWNGATWRAVASQGFASNGVTGLTRANTNKWRAARGNVQAGVKNARILCSGNSITAGAGSTGGSGSQAGLMGSNSASKSYPTQLAQALTLLGLNASWQNWIGGNAANWNATDSRLALGTNFTDSQIAAIGGDAAFASVAGGAGTQFSFTPLTAVDTVLILAPRTSFLLDIAADAGAVITSLNTTGSGPAYLSAPIALTGGLASHQIEARYNNGGVYINGMIAYNSAVKEMTVLRAGQFGAVISSQITGFYAPTAWFSTLAADLTLLAWTRNDYGTGVPIATFIAQYQTVITAALVTGDVILVIEPMGNTVSGDPTPYYNAIYQLAATNSLPLIDFTVLWDAYAKIPTWYIDGIHPQGFAYAEMAREIAAILMSI